MTKTLSVLIVLIGGSCALAGNYGWQEPNRTETRADGALTSQQRQIKVTIATIANLSGSPTDHYKVGDQILVTITMTNTSPEPFKVCISSDLYQNLPELTKDGQVVTVTSWQAADRLAAQRNHTCEDDNLPEPVLLKPSDHKLADWLVLVEGTVPTAAAAAWYDPLPPGKYELSIQRRLNCCDGPMIESNKVSFEVVR